MAKKIKLVTPAGWAVFPHITVKDTEGEYATQKYGTRLNLKSEDVALVKAQLERIAEGETFSVKEPKMPWKKDREGNLTQLYASSQYLPTVLSARKVKLIDGRKADDYSEEFLKAQAIPGGSVIKLACNVFNYKKGLSLQLEAVQIIKLREDNFEGFEDEGDGEAFEAAEANQFGGQESDDDEMPF
jgi:hypothetical protein